MKHGVQHLQSLGRALMLPIAVLPVAALLLRLGQPDLLGLDFVSAARPLPTSPASPTPANPLTIGTNRRPPKKARYSGGFTPEKRL